MRSLILIFSLFFSCTLKDKVNVSVQKVIIGDSSKITIVLHNYPKISDTFEFAPHMFIVQDPPIKVWDEYNQYYLKQTKKSSDTFYLKPTSENILLSNRYNYLKYSEIILHKGDQLEVFYTSNYPTYILNNRSTNKFDFKIDSILNSALYKSDKFTNLEKYNFPILNQTEIGIINFNKQASDKILVSEKAIADLLKEEKIITELKQKDFISEEVFQQNFDRIKFISYKILNETNKLDNQAIKNIIDSSKKLNDNSSYSYFYKFAESYVAKNIEATAPILKGANGSIIDYRYVFMQVCKITFLNTKILDLIKYKYLELIAKNFTSRELVKYSKLLNIEGSDSLIVKKINTIYLNTSDDLNERKDSIFLLNNLKETITLEQLLTNNKVVFIDCWASWCIPCINLIPSSKSLIEKYRNRHLDVIFISFDKNYDDWQRISEKVGIKNYKHNYLVLNQDASKYIKDYKINSFPRYLIYDKNGALTNPNAKDPTNNLTMSEIETLVNK